MGLPAIQRKKKKSLEKNTFNINMCFEKKNNNTLGHVGEQKQKPEVQGAKVKGAAMVEENPNRKRLQRC